MSVLPTGARWAADLVTSFHRRWRVSGRMSLSPGFQPVTGCAITASSAGAWFTG